MRFQLKATDNLKTIQKGRFVSVVVDLANWNHWIWEVVYPFILIVYDAAADRAFWLDVHEYGDEVTINEESETIALRIPMKNKLTVYSIDRFRKKSIDRTAEILKKLFP